jgi:hypothetical protein
MAFEEEEEDVSDLAVLGTPRIEKEPYDCPMSPICYDDSISDVSFFDIFAHVDIDNSNRMSTQP